MPPLTKASVAFNGLLNSLVGLIEDEWRPAAFPTEPKYRDDLLAFLRRNTPADARIEREYRHSGTTADLYVSWQGLLMPDQAYIEIKRDLKQKTAYDRLIGQIESLDPGKRKVLLVLVGDWDEALVGRFCERYDDDLRSTGHLRLAKVKPKKPRRRRKP